MVDGDVVPRETVADEVAHLMAGWEARQCDTCPSKFMARPSYVGRVCAQCSRALEDLDRLNRELESIRPRLGEHEREWLKRAGMSPREMTARLELMPEQVKRIVQAQPMPGGIVTEMLRGATPRHGFGLVGGGGLGKTFALAAIVRAMLRSRWESEIPTLGRKAITRSWLGWVSWPETVNRLRVASTHDAGLAEASAIVESMAEVDVLVLDDIGVERMRGTYEEDWAASQLDVIVDTRYNELRPTWYTMNLRREEFHARYGARLFSRLCGENPPFVIPPGPDLRMVKKSNQGG